MPARLKVSFSRFPLNSAPSCPRYRAQIAAFSTKTKRPQQFFEKKLMQRDKIPIVDCNYNKFQP